MNFRETIGPFSSHVVLLRAVHAARRGPAASQG